MSSRVASTLSGSVILFTALAMRLHYMLTAQVDNPFRADAGQYFRIALNVVSYGIFSVASPGAGVPSPDTYRAPAYPAFIALPIAASGDLEFAYWFVLVAQAVMGAVTALLVFHLVRRWLGTSYAFVAGLVVAVWPHLITQGGYVLTESLFGAIIVICVFVSVRAVESGRAATYLAAGIAFATGALVNQMLMLLPLLVLPLMLRMGRRSSAILFVLAALAPTALWAVRDAMIQSPAAVSAGERLFENILVGMEPDFNRYYQNPTDPLGLAARQRVLQGQEEYVRDRYLAYAHVKARLAQDPIRSLAWFAQKPLLLWAWSIGQGAGDIYVYPMITSPFETNVIFRTDAAICHGLNGVITIAAFAEGIMALVFLWRRRLVKQDLPSVLCAIVFWYATVVYAVLNPDARYANPFRPFEIVLAVAFTARLHSWLSAMRSHGVRLNPEAVNDRSTTGGAPIRI